MPSVNKMATRQHEKWRIDKSVVKIEFCFFGSPKQHQIWTFRFLWFDCELFCALLIISYQCYLRQQWFVIQNEREKNGILFSFLISFALTFLRLLFNVYLYQLPFLFPSAVVWIFALCLLTSSLSSLVI